MNKLKYMVSYTIKRDEEKMIAFNATAFIDLDVDASMTAKEIATTLRQRLADDYVNHYKEGAARREELNKDERYPKFPEIKVPAPIDPARITINNTVLLASFNTDTNIDGPSMSPDKAERAAILTEMLDLIREKKNMIIKEQDFEAAAGLRGIERVLLSEGEKMDTHSLSELLVTAKALRSNKQFNRMKEALEQIVEWKMPSTGLFWNDDKTRPQSWSSAYGSNGERDVIKNIAATALAEEKEIVKLVLKPCLKEIGGTYYWHRDSPLMGKSGNVVIAGVGGSARLKGWQVRFLDNALNTPIFDKPGEFCTLFAGDKELFEKID